MSAVQLNAFLGRPLIARLATSADDCPRVLPMWYWWDGEHMWFETSPTFRNVRTLRANPRAAVVVDESLGGLRLRAAILEGAVDVLEGPADLIHDVVLRIYHRYLEPGSPSPEEMLGGSSHVLLRMTPETIKSWDTTS
jgi:nitroimidazol reductase NimA-like FMN-containing flavoprotein (pyridoxamine 5'-phosphate oxidase superfamily)